MQISVTQALKAPGETFPFSVEKADLLGLELGTRKIALCAPICVNGSFVADAEGVSVTGSLKTAILAECARCLAQVSVSLEADFDVRFKKMGEETRENDDETYPYQGDALDISDMVRDYVLLAIPIRSLCKNDCKGLCEICGYNLNEGACAHKG